jgi:hypothetical protein
VLLHDSVLKSGYLDRNYALTREGRRWLAASNLSAEPTRSPFARPCLDWTEQLPHLAGRLAAQMLQSFFQLGWIARIRDTRAVRVTDRGLREFERQYGLNLRKPV